MLTEGAMDEGQWLATENVWYLLTHLTRTASIHRKKAGRRKLRLLTCACARQMWGQFSSLSRTAVEGVELVADGRLSQQEFDARLELAREAASEEERSRLGTGADAIWGYLVGTTDLVHMPAGIANFVAMRLAYAARLEAPAAGLGPEQSVDALRRAREASHRRACELAREIFGNPFRPLPPRKFPADVRGLAQSCFDDPSHYPLLADALADLGESGAAEHCRLADHVKGCHVVDWVLGKQ
jgi:hypothetical protein